MSESRTPPQAPSRPGGAQEPANEAQKDKVQRQLDEALAESFPASDPVSIVTSQEEEDWGESPVESK